MKLLKSFFVVVLLGASTGLLGCSGCNPCTDEIFDKVASPDGKWTATTLVRDCGATTKETMGVNVQDSKETELKARNYVFAVEHVQNIHLSWRDNNTLVIDCRGCALGEVKKRLQRLGQVEVVYQ